MQKIVAVLITTFALLSFNVFAKDAIETGTFNNKAIYGYDTVAYFTQNKATKGSEKYTSQWRGADWYFSSAEHKALFDENPEKYAPQYGGYCAYAMAAGNFYGIDPDIFTIDKGKLYLNYSAGVQKKWEKKQAEFIIDADKNYPDLVDLTK
ncbi:YHS domain protein [Alteromonas sp. 5E99-2]|uniref:YHS domain-containing (seleno)protein n=1 Tax=Alteromonas sp. 5E99-2 TaxID=2817683 RepID=UPI001A98CEEF|nr:YHS domain-containing (seleno)protein [Alteromonas sp. 5E99-2]MBO1256821.1 YHS domain protein [Alteromonas sp. 5E99-2]